MQKSDLLCDDDDDAYWVKQRRTETRSSRPYPVSVWIHRRINQATKDGVLNLQE